jgi:hypothetical protein
MRSGKWRGAQPEIAVLRVLGDIKRRYYWLTRFSIGLALISYIAD